MNARNSIYILSLCVTLFGCALDTPPDCLETDEPRCNNNASVGMLSTCRDNKWVSEPCKGNEMCADDKSCVETKACTPTATKCSDTNDGGLLIHCDDTGNWRTSEPCPGKKPCMNDTSCQEYTCTPGETQCINQIIGNLNVGTIITCNDDETWEDAHTCEGNASCRDNTSCNAPTTHPMTCSTDQTCANIEGSNVGQLITCSAGILTVSFCPDNHSCKPDNTCGECRNGSVKCEDAIQYTCHDGAWDEATPCDSGRCADDSRCIQCASTCQNDKTTAVGSYTIVCEDKSFAPQACDNDVSCDPEGIGCGVCNNLEPATCSNDGNELGMWSGCRNGERAKDAYCDHVSCNANQCGECLNDTSVCIEKDGKAYMQYCSKGKMSQPNICPGSTKCHSDHTICQGYTLVCITNRLYKDNGTSQRCDNQASCKANYLECDECNNSAPPSCVNNASDIGTETNCKNGVFVTQTCPDKHSCKSEYGITLCGECHNGEVQCESPGVGCKKCVEGRFVES